MNIAVYCSSREDLPQEAFDCARATGEWIGRNRGTLVYGGVNAGLMHVTAQAARAGGGHITGVVPASFKHRADPLCHELVLSRDLNDRKSKMIDLAEHFVVLPGGVGTIDEWLSTLSHLVVSGRDTSRIIVVNLHGMYDPLIEQLELSEQSVYSRGKRVNRSIIVDGAARLVAELERLTQHNK